MTRGVIRWALVIALLGGVAAGGCARSGDRAQETGSSGAGAPGDTDASPAAPPATAPGDATSPAAAAQVIRDYYAAIARGDHAAAYRMWGGEGVASGKTYDAFAAGFANTARVAVSVGPTGPVGAAAGSRYTEIPVRVDAMLRDSTAQQFIGTYVMQRSEVDGATPAQRHWHIASAKLRPVP